MSSMFKDKHENTSNECRRGSVGWLVSDLDWSLSHSRTKGGIIRKLTCIYFTSTSLCSPRSQNTGSCSDIHHDLVLKDIRIPHDSGVVGSHAIVIRQHLFLMVKLSIRTEVVGKVGCLGLGVAIEGRDFACFACIHKVFRHDNAKAIKIVESVGN